VNSPDSIAPPTAIHRLVERCREGDYAPLVGRVASGWVVMGERQVFAGYCLLLPDPVVPQLNALTGAARDAFLADMSRVGDALMSVTGALRINYAIFGNVEPALHAHIFPRFAVEPFESRTAQPWAFDWNLAPAWTDESHGALRRRLAVELSRG
jgi:diadenosine tetraphosphate (Ap4A) HIT family hydrolase